MNDNRGTSNNMISTLGRRDFIGKSLGGLFGASLAGNNASVLFGASATGYKPGPHEPFAGIFPILQTPFFDDERIDTDSFLRQVDFIIEAGGHGLVWPQNASEFQVLTDEERDMMAELLSIQEHLLVR